MKRINFLLWLFAIATTGVLFAGEPYRGIPDAYQQVEWIKSDGQQVIDTGVVSKKTVSAVFDFQVAQNDNGNAIIGHTYRDGDADWRFSAYAYGGCFFDMGNSRAGQNSDCKVSAGVRYQLFMGSVLVDSKLKAYFDLYRHDGTLVGHKVGGNTATGCDDYGLSYTIFVCGGGLNLREYVTVYSLTISDNGTLVRDFVPAKRKSDDVVGLYDMVGGAFYTNAYTAATKDFTCGDPVPGLTLTADSEYDAVNDKVNFEFTAASGSADVYVVITNTVSGGAEWSVLSRTGATKGDVWNHEVSGSLIVPGSIVSYRTVVGDAIETRVMPSFSMAPCVTAVVDEITASNVVVALTIDTPGDASPSADVYLAYGFSGAALTEPTLYKSGCLKGETVRVKLDPLYADTVYDYWIKIRNDKSQSTEVFGTVHTLKAIGKISPDPDPQYTAGSVKFRNVPSAYQQVEYLRSNGDCGSNSGPFVLLGVRSSNLLSAQMDYSPLKSHGGGDIGQNAGSDSTDWRFAPYSGGTFFDIGNSRVMASGSTMSPGARYNIWMGPVGGCASYRIYNEQGELWKSGTSTTKGSASELVEIGVFGNTRASDYYCTSMKLWSLMLWQDVTLVRDLVPVKRTSDELYGLYDFVTGSFLTNVVANKSFVADTQGPAVSGMGVDVTLAYTDCWRLEMTVNSGAGDLYATFENSSGEHSKVLLKLDAEVGDSVAYDFTTLTPGDFYKIGYLVETKDATTGEVRRQYTSIKEVFNGSVTLTAERDADEGKGVLGLFRVALADGAVAPNELKVSYTVEDSSTAIAGQTYALLSGTVTIPAGANSVMINVLPLWDPETTEDTTVVLKLSPGVYNIGTTAAQSILVKSGDSFGGWIYDTTSGLMYDNTWSFTVTDLGLQRVKLVGLNTDTSKGPVPTSAADLDLSKPIITAAGSLYSLTIIGTGCFYGKTDQGRLLGDVVFPEGLVEIQKEAFKGQSYWESELVLPASLRTLGQEAFGSCIRLTIDAAKFPSGVMTIDPLVFNGDILMTGDLYLPNLITEDLRQTFTGTGLHSAHFGPRVTGFYGSPGQGPVQNCKSLTNVTFAAETIYLKSGSCFCGCTALKEIDLSMMTNDGDGGHFSSSGIEKITYGDKLVTLSANAFSGATSLKKVVFTGLPPTTLGTPYLKNVSASQVVTTEVCKANRARTNAVGKCWIDYTANHLIRSKNTTWSSDYLVSGASPANRPLVTDEEVPGLKIILR